MYCKQIGPSKPCACNTISFEMGPRSDRGPGSAPQKLQFGALWGARGPRTPFTPRTSFKGNFVMCRNLSFRGHDGQPHCSILLHARSPRRMLLDLRSRNGFAAGVHSKTEIVLQLGGAQNPCAFSVLTWLHIVLNIFFGSKMVQMGPNMSKYIQVIDILNCVDL